MTRTITPPAIKNDTTAAGPVAWMTTPLPTNKPAPMTPPSAIKFIWRRLRLWRKPSAWVSAASSFDIDFLSAPTNGQQPSGRLTPAVSGDANHRTSGTARHREPVSGRERGPVTLFRLAMASHQSVGPERASFRRPRPTLSARDRGLDVREHRIDTVQELGEHLAVSDQRGRDHDHGGAAIVAPEDHAATLERLR